MLAELSDQTARILIRAVLGDTLTIEEKLEAMTWFLTKTPPKMEMAEAGVRSSDDPPLYWFFAKKQSATYKKIQCIKHLRVWFNLSLFRAKEIVDGLEPIPLSDVYSSSLSEEYVLTTLRSCGAIIQKGTE